MDRTARICSWIVALGLTAVLVGCDQGVRTPEKVDAAASAPVVSVDGAVLTRAQLDAHVGLMLRLMRGSNPKVSEAQYLSMSNQLATTYPSVFVQRTVMRHYADREKVTIPSEMLVRYQRMALRKAAYTKAKSYAELQEKLGAADAAILDSQLRDEVLMEAVKARVIAANPTNLPPDYADRRLKEIRAYNALMTATNAYAYAKATNVWNKLKAGAKFETMVQNYTELEDERPMKGGWGLADKKMLEDFPQLLDAVEKLEPGEFTPPVEGDNGLMIARLDAKDEAKEEYELSRIFFRLPMFARERPANELIDLAKKDHGARVWAETLKRLNDEAKIEYFDKKQNKGNNNEAKQEAGK